MNPTGPGGIDARICGSCGTTASPTARFCASCGAALPEPASVGPLVARPWGEPEPPPPPQPDAPGVPWRAIEAVPVFVIHLFVAAIVAVPFVIAKASENALSAGLIVASAAALLGTTLVWLRARHGVGLAGVGLRSVTGSNIGIGVVAGLGGLAVSVGVTALISALVEAISGEPPPTPEQIPIEGEPSTALLWVLGLSVVVLAPLAEEIFFRGLLFAGLRRWARPWPAALISGVIFGLTHIIPLVILPITALGVLLAWLVEVRRSLVPAIVAHMTFNVVGFWAGYVVQSGGS